MQLKWTRKALTQLKEAEEYIAEDNPQAAKIVVQRVADATLALLKNPELGRPGRIKETREWVVKRTPYLIAYSVDGDYLIILRVIHSKQRWPLKIS